MVWKVIEFYYLLNSTRLVYGKNEVINNLCPITLDVTQQALGQNLENKMIIFLCCVAKIYNVNEIFHGLVSELLYDSFGHQRAMQ